MAVKVKSIAVGVEGITFDAANYTPGSTEKCRRLHGHTFKVDVEVEGDINPKDGMVLDFLVLKKVVKEVIEEFDHKVILPRSEEGSVIIKGNFETSIMYVDKPYVTTEYLALEIAERLSKKIKFRKLKVRLYEGMNKYAQVEVEGVY